jgi:hypothetical protein
MSLWRPNTVSDNYDLIIMAIMSWEKGENNKAKSIVKTTATCYIQPPEFAFVRIVLGVKTSFVKPIHMSGIVSSFFICCIMWIGKSRHSSAADIFYPKKREGVIPGGKSRKKFSPLPGRIISQT